MNSSSSTTRKRNRPAATARVLLSLSFFLSFILQTTLLYDKTDFTVIENYYPYTERERERERKESVVRSLLCVCVIEMWDDRDKKEIQKKYVKRGTKTRSSLFWCFETHSPLQKKN